MPTLTEGQTFEIATRFFRRLEQEGILSVDGTEKSHEQPFIIAVAGFPGSGKTIAAAELARLSEGIHLQANSIRQLLRELGLSWGDNVRAIRDEVIKELLWRRHVVVLDGSVLEDAEFQHLIDMAEEKKAKVFFVAVTTDINEAKVRALRRFADGKGSSFTDWRPSNAQAYFNSMQERSEKLNKFCLRIAGSCVITNVATIQDVRTHTRTIWYGILSILRRDMLKRGS